MWGQSNPSKIQLLFILQFEPHLNCFVAYFIVNKRNCFNHKIQNQNCVCYQIKLDKRTQ